MLSRIQLHLPKPTSTIPSPDELKSLSKFPLPVAQASHITSQEGTLLLQSISHYLAYIQLYEYKINNQQIVDFEVTEPSFFMTTIIEGSSVLYNEVGKVISNISANTTRLSYLSAGKYKRSLTVGNHVILLVALRPDWLEKKYRGHDEMQGFINSYNFDGPQCISLPDFNLRRYVFNCLKKLNEGKDFDIDIHLFTNDCLERYLNRLRAKLETTACQQAKAKAIGEFVNQNFKSKIVDDEEALARRFYTSRITLTRLAKHHFGKPLHKHVIELRMLTGLKMLLMTEDPIQDIALHVGYEDSHYFSRAFKKRFGVSPIEVRRSGRK